MEEQDEDRGSEEETRTLDNAFKASIDLVALNNKVVCMRGTVKKAKIYTIRKLKDRMKKLEEKKGKPEEKEKDQRRLARFKQELHVIRHLKYDLVSKYALGCTETVHDLCNEENDVAIEIRALTRLAEHQLMQLSVKRFRDEHEDWKSLAAFLLTKQSGRRIKKQQGPTPVEKMITNVTTGQLMVKSYLQDKLDRNVHLPKDKNIKKKKKSRQEDVDSGEEIEGTSSSDDDLDPKPTDTGISVDSKSAGVSDDFKSAGVSDDNKSAKTDAENGCKSVKKVKSPTKLKRNKIEIVNFNPNPESVGYENFTSLKKENASKKRKLIAEIQGLDDEENSSDVEEDGDSCSDSEGGGDNDREGVDSGRDSDEEGGDSDEGGGDSDEGGGDSDVGGGDSDEPSSSKAKVSTPKIVQKISGEMVVKKFNLDDDVVDEDFMNRHNVQVFSDEKASMKKRRKVTDAFFVTSDSEEEKGDDGEDSREDPNESDDDMEGTGNQSSKGKTAIRSTFMYSLTESKRSSGHHGAKGKPREEYGKGGRGRGGGDSGGRGSYRGGTKGGLDGSRGRGDFDRGTGNFRGNRGQGNFDGKRGGSSDGQGGSSWKSDKTGFPSSRGAASNNPQQSTADEAPLHPSWQASKKRKEQGTIQAFQGKKIKFDD